MKKIDHNQRAIVKAMRSMGASVQSLADIGKGVPDLLVAWRGKNILIECKNGERQWKLTVAQERWAAAWQAPVHVITSVDQAVEFLNHLTRNDDPVTRMM